MSKLNLKSAVLSIATSASSSDAVSVITDCKQLLHHLLTIDVKVDL